MTCRLASVVILLAETYRDPSDLYEILNNIYYRK